jgi:hypothetical protein
VVGPQGLKQIPDTELYNSHSLNFLPLCFVCTYLARNIAELEWEPII